MYCLPARRKTSYNKLVQNKVCLTAIGLLSIIFSLQIKAQEIMESPQNVTVCHGDKAVFRAESEGGLPGWWINGVPLEEILSVDSNLLSEEAITDQGTTVLSLIFLEKTPITYSNTTVRVRLFSFDGSFASESGPAILTYILNAQHSVTSPTININQTAIQLDWQAFESLYHLNTGYWLSIYETATGNPVLITCNQCHQHLNVTHVELVRRLNRRCYRYEHRVTALECPDTRSGIDQTIYSSISTEDFPSERISALKAEFVSSTVVVNWAIEDSENNTYELAITGLYKEAKPLQPCGDFNLNVALTPPYCQGTGLVRNTNISFHIDCPTTTATPIEVGTEITCESATIRPDIQKLLLTTAAIISMLWRHSLI